MLHLEVDKFDLVIYTEHLIENRKQPYYVIQDIVRVIANYNTHNADMYYYPNRVIILTFMDYLKNKRIEENKLYQEQNKNL